MSEIIKYVEVILPLPLKGTFTYASSREDVLIGQSVIVQFGLRKLYSGIIAKIHTQKPDTFHVKNIVSVLNKQPIVHPIQLKFWSWMAEYYMCNLGDVMSAALPAHFKLASESKIIIHPNFDGDIDGFTPEEILLLDYLSQKGELNISIFQN